MVKPLPENKIDENRYPLGFKKAELTANELADKPDQSIEILQKAYQKAKSKEGNLDGLFDEIYTLIRLIRAWLSGTYVKVPWRTISFGMGALIYFINPFDVIPDFIPAFGLMDDITILTFVLKALRKEITEFKMAEAAVTKASWQKVSQI